MSVYLVLYLSPLLCVICFVAVAVVALALVVLSYVWYACFGTIP